MEKSPSIRTKTPNPFFRADAANPASLVKKHWSSGTQSAWTVKTLFLPMVLWVAGCAASQVPDIAIRDVTVVDVREARLRSGVTVLLRGDRILEVTEGHPLPKATQVVDGMGKYLIPGLWDMHVHLAGVDPDPKAAEHLVAHGVTGVRDMGGRIQELEQIRQSIQTDTRLGPQIFRAGPTLNGNQPANFHRVVVTPETGTAAVRELALAGVDFIKVHNAMKPEVFDAVIREATKFGLAVVGHVPYGISLIDASNAGMRSIEHAEVLMETEIFRSNDPAKGMGEALARLEGELGQDLFQTLASNGTALTPTLSAYALFVESQTDEKARAMGESLFNRLKRIVPFAHSNGVTILAGSDGTDADSGAGSRLLRELELLVEAGLSPVEALRAATLAPASFLGLSDEGEIANGMKANAVLLDADPLENIQNITRIQAVILAGRLIGFEELHRLRSAAESFEDR